MLFVWFSFKALRLLRRLPYGRHRLANVVLRLQLRESLVVMVVGISTLVLLEFVSYGMPCGPLTLAVRQYVRQYVRQCATVCTVSIHIQMQLHHIDTSRQLQWRHVALYDWLH